MVALRSVVAGCAKHGQTPSDGSVQVIRGKLQNFSVINLLTCHDDREKPIDLARGSYKVDKLVTCRESKQCR